MIHDDGESFTCLAFSSAIRYTLYSTYLVADHILSYLAPPTHLTFLLPQVETMGTLILNSLQIHPFRGFRPRERARMRRFKLIGTPKNTRQNATDLPCIFSWTRCQSDLSQGGHPDLAAGSGPGTSLGCHVEPWERSGSDSAPTRFLTALHAKIVRTPWQYASYCIFSWDRVYYSQY